jgi:hypothetical protein
MQAPIVKKRVLARRLARELTFAEIQQVCGQGTSYFGTGTCADGRGEDVEGRDCVNGADTYQC